MTDATELDDLEGVTQHPGWSRIRARLAAEWGQAGSRYVTNLERLANNTDREQAATDLQLVIMVRKEIEAFFAGIDARVRQLKNTHAPVESVSRRGSL